MFYLILAITSSVLVSFVMKISVDRIDNNISMLASSYITCMFLTFLYLYPWKINVEARGTGTAVILGIIAGSLLLAGFVLLQFNVRVNGVVLSAAFAKLGVLVPTVLSIVFFKEIMEAGQIIGFALALTAIVLIHFEKGQENAGFKTGLLLLLLCNGAADAMAKIYEQLGNPQLKDEYLCITFIVASVLSTLLAVKKGQKITRKDVLWGMLLGIPNYYSVRFLMKALETIPAVIAYPTYSVATIIVLSMCGALLFGEKLSRRQKISAGIILIALVLLNM